MPLGSHEAFGDLDGDGDVDVLGSFGGPSVADTLADNFVDCQRASSYGVWVFNPYRNVAVSDNDVVNNYIGLGLFGGQSGARPVFSGNEVDGEGSGLIGAYLSTTIFGFGSANASVQFGPNNEVFDNDYNVYVEQEVGFTTDAGTCAMSAAN